ncbi:MAG: sigma-70 family RNA polymerase sigma factor [Bacteroidaceae bacterium]|nr:sigma-70 family RNA polymerase sigma factor [Bacteroidaceae bacterium]
MNAQELKFTEMVRQQKSTIYTVCLMFCDDPDATEDLVQQTLINLWNGFETFRGDSDVRTWVWRVAMNTCITADRKEKKRSETTASLERFGIDSQAEDPRADDRQIGMLYDRIHRLGVFDRAIVLLWLENLPYDEIGSIVGITAKNVSVRLARIRQQLKEMD